MSTISRRKATWSNPDNLVVGYGTHYPPTSSGQTKTFGAQQVSKCYFDWTDLNAARTIGCDVPAGCRVIDVRINVNTTFTSTGSNTITVGDGSTANGFITTSSTATASLTAGASINPDGVYAFGATDTGAAELKTYAAATTIVVASADTDWTAGQATLVVTYSGPEV